MKWVTLVLIIMAVYSHHRLWMARGSYSDMVRLEETIEKQTAKNDKLTFRNAGLAAEVDELSQGRDATIEIARVDLGYIKQGEIFYRFVQPVEKTQ